MFKHFRAAATVTACLVTLALSALPAWSKNLYVTGNDVNLRDKPSADGRVLTHLPYRTAVTFLQGPSHGWYRVKAGATTGYLSAQLASTSAPAAKAPKAPSFAHTGKGYINSDGNWIPSPVHAASAPQGATALCNDGTFSFSQHHRGTCSHHGGVKTWL